jgi:hypothetical protein
LVFSGTTLFLLRLYSYVHWRLLFGGHRDEVAALPGLGNSLLFVLRQLEVYRLFGVLAVIWAVWSLGGRPRWVGATALVVSLAALLMAMVIQ